MATIQDLFHQLKKAKEANLILSYEYNPIQLEIALIPQTKNAQKQQLRSHLYNKYGLMSDLIGHDYNTLRAWNRMTGKFAPSSAWDDMEPTKSPAPFLDAMDAVESDPTPFKGFSPREQED